MSNACTPSLVGMAPPVLEILLLSNLAKFLFRTMDYSPCGVKSTPCEIKDCHEIDNLQLLITN